MKFRHALPPVLYEQVTSEHPYEFAAPVRPAANQVALDRRWRLVFDDSCGPLSRLAADDLQRTLRHTFKLGMSRKREVGAPAIAVAVKESAGDTQESYQLEVQSDQVRILAADDEGGMRALFHLRQAMLNARGPLLEIGRWDRSPRWSLRITSPVLHRGLDEPRDYLELPRSYLLNMARYGYNATYIYLNWLSYMRPRDAGALARQGWQSRLDELDRAAEYLGRFGIRLLFHLNTLALPAGHSQFARTPRSRGAQTWSKGLHCLCSSSPEVLALYERAAHQLFTDVPALAGAVLIVGGECFLHCYTRPFPRPGNSTNCPWCRERSPDRVVGDVVNAFARGALRASSNAHMLVWPYSAFAWGDASVQQKFIDRLHPATSLLTAFEKDDWISIDGTRSYVFDYSISQLGPSPLFRKLQARARRRGLKVFAKTETSQSIEMFYVPRIPIMQRWALRYAKLRDRHLDGVHTTWRFYGFCAQRTDEIVDYFNWESRPNINSLMRQMAVRDFGPGAAPKVVVAWKRFSDTFARFPYSAGITGFPYWRGPFYLGPAHPFVFDLTTSLNLSDRFWTLDPGVGEITDAQTHLALAREPRFFMDLTWTQPFGVETMLRRLADLDRGWSRGMSALLAARASTRGQNRARLDSEIRVSQFIGCMFRTAHHLARFQQFREHITAQPCTPARLLSSCRGAIEVLQNEIANAQLALPLVEQDGSLGYSATYGYALDAEMIREKIEHSRRQIKDVIPRFFSQYAFHIYGSAEQLPVTQPRRLRKS